MDFEEIKLRIVDRYTVEELVEVLGITIEEIIESFENKIELNFERLDIN